MLLLGMKMMGMKTHGLHSALGFVPWFFPLSLFFSSGPWQMSVTHPELGILHGASSGGFVSKSIQQGPDVAAIKSRPKPPFS